MVGKRGDALALLRGLPDPELIAEVIIENIRGAILP